MAIATRAWEDAAGVDFRYDPTQDGNCLATNGNVVFDIRPGGGLASAFFPHYARSARTPWLGAAAFNNPDFPLAGILRHELGHALGFRHEQNRPQSGCAQEDEWWRAVTPYDVESVMHYRGCDTTGGAPFVLTALDRMGARLVYGPPIDHRPRLNDYQGDGRDDLLCHDGSIGSGIKWVDFADGAGRLNGTDWQGSQAWCGHPTGQLLVGDFNGDNGDRPDDLLCHDTLSGFKWIDYASGGTFTGTNWQREARFCNHDSARLLTGDFNGDGSDDLLCHDHSTGHKWIDYASGGQFNGSNWERNGMFCSHDTGRLFVGDFNGDGRDDLLCHDDDSGFKWVDYADGNGQFLGTNWQGGSGAYCSHDSGQMVVETSTATAVTI